LSMLFPRRSHPYGEALTNSHSCEVQELSNHIREPLWRAKHRRGAERECWLGVGNLPMLKPSY
jgi:hypothetical protein